MYPYSKIIYNTFLIKSFKFIFIVKSFKMYPYSKIIYNAFL